MKKLGQFLVCAFLLWINPSNAAEKILFLHFNDVYEYNPNSQGMGGFAPFMTVIERERAKNPHNITTFGGDLISPSMASSTTRGKHMIDFLNNFRIDAAVLGNHEFDFGSQTLRERIKESRFPWLVSNVSELNGEPFAKQPRSLIIEKSGIKIGFFSLLTSATQQLSTSGNEVKFGPEINTAKEMVAQLKGQGAQVIVALTHLDLEEDRLLARQVKDIDIILGGHDHDAYALQEGGALIIKAGHDVEYLATIELLVDNSSKIPLNWQFIAIKDLANHPETQKLVDKYNKQLDQSLKVPIAKITTEMDSRKTIVREQESALANLFTDALKESLNADIALLNGGGFRGNKLYPAGYQLTRKDVIAEMPFNNVGMVLSISGAELLNVLEYAVSDVENKSGRFPQVSGINLVYDPTKPVGSRILEARVNGNPLDPTANYKLATIDYLYNGGDGYTMLKSVPTIIDASAGRLITTLVIDKLAQKSEYSPKEEGRVIQKTGISNQ